MRGKLSALPSIESYFSPASSSNASPCSFQFHGAGEGTDPYGYMTAHAAMSSGVSAACDVLQTVITSRIKSVLPLQVSGILFHATASQKQFFWTTFDAGHAPSHTRPGRHAPHALKNVVVTTARFARQDALIFAVETNTGLLCN
jgi:hypothetical protein